MWRRSLGKLRQARCRRQALSHMLFELVAGNDAAPQQHVDPALALCLSPGRGRCELSAIPWTASDRQRVVGCAVIAWTRMIGPGALCPTPRMQLLGACCPDTLLLISPPLVNRFGFTGANGGWLPRSLGRRSGPRCTWVIIAHPL
eukprot:scaffold6323_cov121-Isochrysis_galbana.AAC.1